MITLVANLIEKGEIEFQAAWIPSEQYQQIRETCQRLGTAWMKPIKDALPPERTYDEIRLVLAQVRNEQKSPPTVS